MQGLGYKEILDYLDGDHYIAGSSRDPEDEIPDILQSARSPGLSGNEDVIWLNKQDYAYDEDKILGTMLEILREKDIIK